MFRTENIKHPKDKRRRVKNYERGPWKMERHNFRWSRLWKLCLDHGFKDASNPDDRAYGNDFASIGITAVRLYHFTEIYCPEEIARFKQWRWSGGLPPTPSRIYQRFHKMYSRHKGKGKGCAYGLSGEHPIHWRAECPELDNEAARRVRALGGDY